MENIYEFEWDYAVDHYVSDEVRKFVEDYSAYLTKKLLPKLKMFKQFRVGFLKDTDCIATYINGTSSHPHVGLNIKDIKKWSKKYKCDFYSAIRTSILHELGHAIQECCDLPFDEDEAENFAYMYHEWDELNQFWKE